MDKQKKADKMAIFLIAILILMVVLAFIGKIFNLFYEENAKFYGNTVSSNCLNILSSSENEDLEPIVQEYARKQGYEINIEYAGTLDIMQRLNQGEKFDAVWSSNSIWVYMLNDNVKVSNSKCTSINPVVFGIKKSKAEELGFVGKEVHTENIVKAISSGKLKFSMSNPTSTNSGASAYLGLLSTLAGNPEVLTQENLEDEKLKEKLVKLFSGLERSSGSEDFLEELFLNGDYEAVVTYESSIININKQLKAQGKEVLYAIYPVDGVSIADSPLAYIDNSDESKEEIFLNLRNYILSDEGQKLLQEKGRRTWYGGVTENADSNIFNPDWGIDTKTYITPTKYPNTEVIKLALNLYQNELRKPLHLVFCLDYSGSMSGIGNKELMEAMDYVLSGELSNDFLQFSEKDKIDVIPFESRVGDVLSAKNGIDTKSLLTSIQSITPNGSTALYPAAIQAIKNLENEDNDKYNLSIVLMTDGEGNVGTFNDLKSVYNSSKKKVPIYSIMFGSANESQLRQIANLTNGKIFDGKTDLTKAFKEVRGYN